jgi:hypothetical protein
MGLLLIGLLLGSCQSFALETPPAVPTSTPFQFVTATPKPSPTVPPATRTAFPTSTPLPPTPTFTATLDLTAVYLATHSRSTYTPTATETGFCATAPEGVFLQVYLSDPGLPSLLSCVTAPANSSDPPYIWPVDVIYQPFERGHMLRLSNVGWFSSPVVYVALDDSTYVRYGDTYDPLNGPSSTEESPEGLFAPTGALAKIWRNTDGLKERIGFGTAQEVLSEGSQMQMFVYGEMVYIQAINTMFVFKRGTPNTWSLYSNVSP